MIVVGLWKYCSIWIRTAGMYCYSWGQGGNKECTWTFRLWEFVGTWSAEFYVCCTVHDNIIV